MESIKGNILKIRIDAPTLKLLERARTYVEVNKSQFIRQSIREKAEAVIAEHENTVFSEEDWYMFFDLIDNPPTATAAMKKAAQKYREIIASDAI